MKKDFKKFCKETLEKLFKISELPFRYRLEFATIDEEDRRWADNAVDYVHFESTITVYPRLKDRFSEGDVEYVINTLAHEVAHCYTEPTYTTLVQASKGMQITNYTIDEKREQLTQQIGNLLQKLLTRSSK